MPVPYATREPFIANTDSAWFEFLTSRAKSGRVDEVNFWQPQASRPMRHMEPGEPVFFRLEKPTCAIAGYGFYAHFMAVDLDTAWTTFTWKNGDPDKGRFLQRIGEPLRTDWNDGKRHDNHADGKLRVPSEKALQPSRDALAWHYENVFKKAG